MSIHQKVGKPEDYVYPLISRRPLLMTQAGIAEYRFDMRDIALGLSRSYRYAGQSSFTVAKHSIIVAQVVYDMTRCPELAKRALLHDAPEAFMCEVPQPCRTLKTVEWRLLEEGLQTAIYGEFISSAHNLAIDEAFIKLVDKAVVYNEFIVDHGEYPEKGVAANSLFSKTTARLVKDVSFGEYEYEDFLSYAQHLGMYHGSTTLPERLRGGAMARPCQEDG